ncbi:MAG: hypothetical protein RI897_4070 [Verrucomicrobiota bacterium]
MLVFIGGELLVVAVGFLDEVTGVVAGVGDDFAAFDFVDLVDDFVHELAVVGDEEDGAGIFFEVILEPEEGEEVEVVGGFVEEEEVGFDDEESGEVCAHDPATAHGLGFASEVGVFEAEPAEEVFGFGFGLGIVEFVVAGVGVEVIGGGDVAGFLKFAEFDLELGQFVDAAGGDVEDGFVADGFGFLREVADDGPFIAFHRAGVGFELFKDDGEESGFAGAVGAD